jgi:Holliday junction resolvase RusA-like endonuclease
VEGLYNLLMEESMKKVTHIETFIPFLPIPKAYRQFGQRTVLGDKCRKYQTDVAAFLEDEITERDLDGYLWAEYMFCMPRKKKSKELFPAVKPDFDNLIKSTQDCLEIAGIIKNDSRIVWCQASKVFADAAGYDEPGTFMKLGTLQPYTCSEQDKPLETCS